MCVCVRVRGWLAASVRLHGGILLCRLTCEGVGVSERVGVGVGVGV